MKQNLLVDTRLPFFWKIYQEQNPNSRIIFPATDINKIDWNESLIFEWSIIRAMNNVQDTDFADVAPAALREDIIAKTKLYSQWSSFLEESHTEKTEAYWDTLKQFIKKGISPNTPSVNGKYCLLEAAKEGNIEIIQFIIDHGGELEILDEQGNSILLQALSYHHMSLVKWLIQEKKVDVNAQNQAGESALNILIRRGMFSELNWFLKLEYEGKKVVNINDPKAARDAVQRGIPKWDAIDLLVKFGMDINIKDKEGNTLAHSAAENGDLIAFKWLKDQGAILTIPNYNGKTPLHVVLDHQRGASESITLVKWLVLEGQNLNVKDNENCSPLELACNDSYQKWPVEDIVWLVQHGANVQDKGAIFAAARSGRVDIIQKFFDEGIDLDIYNNEGKSVIENLFVFSHEPDHLLQFCQKFISRHPSFDASPLLIQAAYRGYNQLCHYLLLNIKLNLHKTNERGNTALHYADRVSLAIGKRMIQKGAEINAKNKEQKTPLDTAKTSNLDWIRFLILNGGNVANNPLLSDRNIIQNFDFVVFLIEHGVDIHLGRYPSEIPLFIALQSADIEVIKLLLKKGVDPNVKFVETYLDYVSKDTRTPLYFLIEEGKVMEVEYFIEKGAQLNVQDKQLTTPLHHAVSEGKLKIDLVTCILNSNPDINMQDRNKDTALHLACEQKDIDLVRLLLAKKPNLELTNSLGMTPLLLAMQKEAFDIVDILLAAGADPNSNAGERYIFMRQEQQELIAQTRERLNQYAKSSTSEMKPRLHEQIVTDFQLVKKIPEKSKRKSEPQKKILNNSDSTTPTTKIIVPTSKIEKEWMTFLDEPHSEITSEYWNKMQDYLMKGVSPNIASANGQYCLLEAAKAGQLDLIKLILEKGGDLDTTDTQGNSILLVALAANQMSVVKWLVEKNVDLNSKNKAGKSALYFMIRHGKLNDLEWYLNLEPQGKRRVEVNDPIAVFSAEKKIKMDELEVLVNHGLDINIRDKNGNTLAHVSRVSMLKWLQSKGADLTLRNNNGDTPLHEALHDDHRRISGSYSDVNWLIRNGCDPNEKDSRGASPLELACLNDWKLEEINWLINHGANPKDSGAALQAAYHGRADIIQKFMGDFDLDIYDAQNRSLVEILVASSEVDKCPLELIKKLTSRQKSFNSSALLFFATQKGHIALCEWLLTKNANGFVKDEEGNTTCHFLSNLPLSLAKRIFQRGADLNAKNNKGETALAVANTRNPDWIQFLILQGAEVTGIPLLANRDVLANLFFVKFLVEKGVDVRKPNEHQETPLFFAINNNFTSVIKILVEHGADPNERIEDRKKISLEEGRTPLYFLIEKGNVKAIKFIIKSGAHLNVQDKRLRTPLHHAISAGKLKLSVLPVLLRANPDINLQDNEGNTPLHLACQQQDVDLVQLLLEKNPNIELKNQEGMTPLLIAMKEGALDVVRSLLAVGANPDEKAGENTLLALAQHQGLVDEATILLKQFSKRSTTVNTTSAFFQPASRTLLDDTQTIQSSSKTPGTTR